MTARVRTNERAATVPASRSHGFRNPSPIVRVLMLLGLAVWSWGQTPVAQAVSESSVQPALRSPINPFGTVEEFPAVEARYVRMVIINSTLGEPCIDEFQVFSADTPVRNVALASGGARASASGVLRAEFPPDHVHDGRHHSALTWIAHGRTNAWLELELPKVERINRIVWSRDGTGAYFDRVPIDYRIEVAAERSAWRQVASSGDHLPLPDLLELPPRDPRELPRGYLLQAGSEEEAFPHSRVNDIAQTPDGYLWMATEQGLVRFDGNQFTIFHGGNAAPFLQGEVRALEVDRKGRLLVHSADPANRVAAYEQGRLAWLEPQDASLMYAFEDDEGVAWGTGDEGIFPWRNGSFDRAAGLTELRNRGRIRCAVGPDATVWLSRLGLAGRLVRGRFWPLLGSDGRALVLGTTNLPAKIVPRPDHGAWILEGGLFEETRHGPNRWRQVSADGRVTEPRPFPWPELNFDYRAPTLDRAGNLWLYVSGLGLVKLSPDGQRYEVYGKTEGLNENEVCTVFEDRQQNLWVWDRRGTVRRLRQPLLATLDSRWGLRTDNVYSLSPARQGGVWIGTHNSGAYLWREDRLFAFWKAKPHSWSMLEDREGGLWNGTYGWGLRRFRAGHEELIRSPEAGDHGHALALFEDRSSRVWIGGQHGLSRYDPTTGAVKTFVPPRFDPGYPDWVTSLAEDREGAIWLGTRGGFLHRFQNGEFQTLLAPKGDPIHAVCSLRFLRPDELWFARFGDGVSRLKDGQLSHYTVADGLPAATINGLLDDGRGHLWMTSKQGVFRISNQEFEAFAQRKTGAFHWQRFTRRDGLPSEECHGEQNQPTLCQTADGRIWIPTVGGIGVIDPATLADTDTPAPAIIQEAQVMSRGNRVLTLLADGAFDPAQPPTLTIPAGANNLVIRYTGIDLANPSKVRFTYRLDGLDPDWVDAKGARTAVYAALAPGSYQFQLIAINEHGTPSPPARLGLRVLPAWWQTWTSRVVLGALFLLAGPIFYLRRVDLLKRRAVAQTAFARQLIEREEAERKRIADQIHDVLGHDLLLLKNSAEQGAQATTSPAPAREQFELISGLASRTLEEARDISHRLRPPELDRLGFRLAIEALLAKVAATSGLRVFQEVADLDAVLPPDTQVFLYRLVQEGLNNVLKHARASIVMLEIKRDGDSLAIKLEDDGVGFEVAAAAQARAGLGLIGMEERVRLVDGQFEVASTPGAGTRIRITIPLPAR